MSLCEWFILPPWGTYLLSNFYWFLSTSPSTLIAISVFPDYCPVPPVQLPSFPLFLVSFAKVIILPNISINCPSLFHILHDETSSFLFHIYNFHHAQPQINTTFPKMIPSNPPKRVQLPYSSYCRGERFMRWFNSRCKNTALWSLSSSYHHSVILLKNTNNNDNTSIKYSLPQKR